MVRRFHILSIILLAATLAASACVTPIPTSTPKPTTTPALTPTPTLPTGAFFIDPAELALDPHVVTVVLGSVTEAHGWVNVIQAPGSYAYEDYAVHVEQYVLYPQSSPDITVRVIVSLLRIPPTGSTSPITGIPPGDPQLNVGEHVLLFLSKNGSEFHIIGPLAGKFIVEGDQVKDVSEVVRWPLVPLDEVLSRIRNAQTLRVPTHTPYQSPTPGTITPWPTPPGPATATPSPPTATPTASPAPTLTPTSTPGRVSLVQPPIHVQTQPTTIAQDGRMVVWDVPDTPAGSDAVWSLIDDHRTWRLMPAPGLSLPPYPGAQAILRNLFISSPPDILAWPGAKVRVYGYPVTETVQSHGFLPKNGTDPELLENLEQAAFFLGEAQGGIADPMITLASPAMLAGKPVTSEDLIAQGKMQLFTVTDTGQFSVGDQVQFVQPYSLTITPANAKPGETVMVEGTGLLPANDKVSVTATLRFATPQGGSRSHTLKVADVQTLNGRFSVQWQVPATVDVTKSGESYIPGDAVTVQPQEAALEVRYPALALLAPSTAPPFPPYIATATPSGPSSKTLYTLSLFVGADKLQSP